MKSVLKIVDVQLSLQMWWYADSTLKNVPGKEQYVGGKSELEGYKATGKWQVDQETAESLHMCSCIISFILMKKKLAARYLLCPSEILGCNCSEY